MGDYDTAYETAEETLNWLIKAFHDNMKSKALSDNPEFCANSERKIAFQSEMCIRLKNHDADWINAHLSANEQKSRITLGLEKPNEKG
jgi:hypothetical protein